MHPPNIQSFDPANKSIALHPSRRSRLQATTPGPSPASSDLATLTSVLLLDMARERLASNPTPSLIPSTPVPKTPVKLTDSTQSPVIPTPTKLNRFLQYAESNLGVENAQALEPTLRGLGAGPDILPEMDDTVLREAGINPGDIIRLKRGSKVWWSGPEAKRKRTATQSEPAEAPQATKRKFQYERRYDDGGAARITGGPIMPAEDGDDGREYRDFDWYYKCENANDWLPVPRGWIVEEE